MIYNEDVVEWAKRYDGEPFHALLTDAPYHLTSIVKRFGKKDSVPAKFGTDGVYARAGRGFMGNTWDGGDIAFRPETWELMGRHLYPGAFGMAFAASRNSHRMAVAIEDAGFVLHPTVFLWAYGQGFPKATRVKGNEVFDGHRYGLQALKPAVEPIIVFQKPYDGKPVENISKTGAGTLNVDGGRIPLATNDEYVINTFDDGAKPFGDGAGHKYTSRKVGEDKRLGGNGSWKTDKAAKNVYEGGYVGLDIKSSPLGRWPSNLLLTEESAERLDNRYGYFSKFFYQVSSQLDECDPVFYCGKVMPKERNAGLDEKNPHPALKPISLCEYLAKLLLPPVEYAPRRILVPFSGVGSEMIGSYLAGWDEVTGVEFDKENGYVDIAEKRIEYWKAKNGLL